MTPQEHQALTTLLSQLTQIRGIPKDPEAESMIAQAVAQQPDAAYLLVQRAMLLEQALDAARAQIADLERRVETAPPPARGGSFLDANGWGNSAGGAARGMEEQSVTGRPLPPAGQGAYAGAPAPGASGVQAAPAARGRGPGMFGGGGGSMLGTLAATAAGVAGGAFLFQGIGNLLGNHHPAASQASADATPASDAAPLADSSASSFSSTDQSARDDATTDSSFLDDSFAGDSSFDSGGDDSYDV
jgi:hypothetical protein